MIYFTSDLHFGHQNILNLCPGRPFSAEHDIHAHDDFLISLWNSTINDTDEVYFLGDFSFHKSEETRRILEQLSGKKHLIFGNHDKSLKSLTKYFASHNQMLDIRFKASEHSSLYEDINVTLCHYPMLSWNHKSKGSVMLHGHSHGTFDEYNEQSEDMRFDIGIDSDLSHRLGNIKGTCVSLISLLDIVHLISKKRFDINNHDPRGHYATLEEHYEMMRVMRKITAEVESSDDVVDLDSYHNPK